MWALSIHISAAMNMSAACAEIVTAESVVAMSAAQSLEKMRSAVCADITTMTA